MSAWTGSLIAPDQRVHDAAHMAIDHVGRQDILRATVDPTHPEHPSNTMPNTTAILTSQVLHDPTLGSRTLAGAQPAPGTPVGSASVSQAGGVPQAIQQAIGNLQGNTQTSDLMQILQQVLHGTSAPPPPTSPAQDDYFKSQTALNDTRNKILQAPAQLQSQIDSLQSNNVGIMSMAPALPGQYNPAKDNALQALYGQQAAAKQQTTNGWTAPTY